MSKNKLKVITTITTTTTEEIINNEERTQIICLLDRSGSMSSIINDSIGGFNQFLKEQRDLSDKATLSIILFDHQYEVLYDNVDISNVKDITEKQWSPRGMTALYDAIGKTITDAKANFEKNNKPSKILMCIVTDGYENASKEFSHDNIKKLIKKSEKDDWNFIYLAANQNAFDVGTNFGVSAGNTYTYTTTADGIFNMSVTLSNATSKYRAMNSCDGNFGSYSKSLINDKSNDKSNGTNSGDYSSSSTSDPSSLGEE